MSNYPLWGTFGDTDGMVVDPPVMNGTSAGNLFADWLRLKMVKAFGFNSHNWLRFPNCLVSDFVEHPNIFAA